MAFGVLEDRHMAMPPGTSILDDSGPKNGDAVAIGDISNAKKDGDIILNPQPSDSPNDPLNWPAAKKYVIIVLLSIISAAVFGISGMLTTAIPIIAREFGVDADAVSRWTVGFLVFWTGAAAFFTAAGANVIGKRPFILGSLLVMVATNIWGAFRTSFVSLIALRTLQGVASAPYETMVTGSISDLFFLHQRGKLLAMWNIVINVGMGVGQIIAGTIIENVGYRGTFGFSAVVFGVLLVGGFFAIVETTYTKPRPKIGGPGTSTTASDTPPSPASTFSLSRAESKADAGPVLHVTSCESQEALATKPTLTETFSESSKPTFTVTESEYVPNGSESEKKERYLSQLRVFRGRVSSANFLGELVRPFPMIVCPAVLYGAIVNGISFALLICVFLLSTIILGMPPYQLSPSRLALVQLPGLVVSLIVSPISGWLADAVAKRIARRNNGVFEPEFRLLLLLIGVPISTLAVAGFGESVAREHPLPVVLVWLGLQNMGLPFVIQGVLSYVLDCSGGDANLAFVAIGFFRSLFTFIGTSFMTGIMLSVGPRTFFFSLAAFNLGISLFTIPTYVYGKKLRSLVARSKIGEKLAREQTE